MKKKIKIIIALSFALIFANLLILNGNKINAEEVVFDEGKEPESQDENIHSNKSEAIDNEDTENTDSPIQVYDSIPIDEESTENSNMVIQPYAAQGVYFINGVEFHNGIWQLCCSSLCQDGFNWTDNGIPLAAVDFTDVNGNVLGNQTWNGTQKYFKFRKGVKYTGKSGLGTAARIWYEHTYPGYGTWWMTSKKTIN
ncbi:lytic exoenzyme target recognition domain-containing protein [Breznakia pachnodae]|uniref:Lytic exoenzyme target recognition domain-containing protein n=1 Tax=Breznakia pachnodae TaxID=265178 RepID=A0ABU0E7K9_9FIRM|nr:lytic exoenzyme target recognition domain-containing protein [Breznakia pachnodae]MDQ0362790.1 hypothetical protein [Breznakia pachnodae]